jgi:exodeoxyribonuclease VII large subunit
MKEGAQQNSGDNAPYLTIAELSQALKATVEGAFEFVRVRAEISRPTRAPSGHLYFTLKDDRSTLAAVCWKTMSANLAVQPEEGLEVIASGKLTTYPGQSKYQIVVSQLEIAGEGALLKQLEERRRMLAAEGLFAPERKKALPRMPATIGVVTSPTGAVIRDILHRLHDRFGVHVLLWGTLVQGRDAAAQVAAAIRGFDAMPADGPLPRPDVLIVARGGGSLEDLWAFNEEMVVRAVADCRIPVISAIGHETDTTLIDHAADLRAPTPTAAAELAVPVKTELQTQLKELDARLMRAATLKIDQSGQKVAFARRGLVDPADMIQQRAQMLDYALAGLASGLDKWLSVRALRLSRAIGRLRPPEARLGESRARLVQLVQRFDQQVEQSLSLRRQRLENLGKLLDANSFRRVLDRGFALVTDDAGKPVKRAAAAAANAAVTIRFADGSRQAVLDVAAPPTAKPAKLAKARAKPDDGQDQLF